MENALSVAETPPPTLTPEQEDVAMRLTRGFLLNECDWTQLLDNDLTDAEKEEWRVYRQKLRDITKDPNWPYVQWPEKPWPI